MTEKDLSRALRDSVADVRLSPAVREAVRDEMNGGYPVRRKWTVGLVLAIVLLLATAAAGAWSLSREFFEKTAAIQFESGYYDDWSLEEKRGFVDLMAEYELIEAETAKDLKKQDETALDAWMAARYGINGRTDVIGLMSVVETELGGMEHWSNDTWVWFNELELKIGQLSSWDPYICLTPGEEAVIPEAAIAAAREAVVEQSGMDAAVFEAAQIYWTYQALPTDTARENAWYRIVFKLADGSVTWGEVRKDGTVKLVYGDWMTQEQHEAIEWDSPNPQFDAYLKVEHTYADEHGLELSDEHRWPLEDKKAVAELQEPIIKEALLAGWLDLTPGEVFQTIYGYGVPEGDVIPQEKAVEIVRGALTEKFGLTEELAAYYFEQEVWVDYLTRNASEEGHPVWRITFWCTSREDMAAHGLGDDDHDFSVFVDAVTGAVINSELLEYNVSADPKVQAVQRLLREKGAPANWTDEEWNAYLPWTREN